MSQMSHLVRGRFHCVCTMALGMTLIQLNNSMPTFVNKDITSPLYVRSARGSGPTSFGGGFEFQIDRASGTTSTVLESRLRNYEGPCIFSNY